MNAEFCIACGAAGIRFVSVGEQMGDLLEFDAGAFVDSMLE